MSVTLLRKQLLVCRQCPFSLLFVYCLISSNLTPFLLSAAIMSVWIMAPVWDSSTLRAAWCSLLLLPLDPTSATRLMAEDKSQVSPAPRHRVQPRVLSLDDPRVWTDQRKVRVPDWEAEHVDAGENHCLASHSLQPLGSLSIKWKLYFCPPCRTWWGSNWKSWSSI